MTRVSAIRIATTPPTTKTVDSSGFAATLMMSAPMAKSSARRMVLLRA
jgi:hypothetical protein